MGGLGLLGRTVPLGATRHTTASQSMACPMILGRVLLGNEHPRGTRTHDAGLLGEEPRKHQDYGYRLQYLRPGRPWITIT